MDINDKEIGGVVQINLVWDKDKWRALVKKVINLRVP
jgi:hypothetical protein